jgi:hypothetical protein
MVDVAALIARPEEFRALADEHAEHWEMQANPQSVGSDFFFTWAM